MVVCAAIVIMGCTSPPPAQIRAVTGIAQGTTYALQWIGGSAEPDVAAAAERELERIDALLSNYRSDSTLEEFNAARSVAPIELPAELITLLELAKRVHAASDGCFDPTVRPLVRAWGFDGDDPAVPTAAAVAEARAVVGLDKLELLDGTRARKTVPQLEIDMASIGQGYTAGRLADVLEQHGSTAYLAEIGGEIVARGTKADGSPWRVGLENPVDDARPSPRLRIPLQSRTAVVTSGSYRHYLDAGGRRWGTSSIHEAASRWTTRCCPSPWWAPMPQRPQLGERRCCAWDLRRASPRRIGSGLLLSSGGSPRLRSS